MSSVFSDDGYKKELNLAETIKRKPVSKPEVHDGIFAEKKSRNTRELEQLRQEVDNIYKNFVSRDEAMQYIVEPFKKLTNMLMLNLLSVTNLLIESEIFTEEQLAEAIENASKKLQETHKLKDNENGQ